jgi:hypothetical protein
VVDSHHATFPCSLTRGTLSLSFSEAACQYVTQVSSAFYNRLLRKKRAFPLWILALLAASSCGTQEQSRDTAGAKGTLPLTGSYRLQGDSVVVPPFAVQVQLSNKADRQLAIRAETIIVAVYLEGGPIGHSTNTAPLAKEGGVRVAEARIELRTGRIARFSSIKVARSLYDQLAEKDLDLLVNVVSGRRSTQDNLLDCTIIQEKISAVAGRTRLTTGHLLEGDE